MAKRKRWTYLVSGTGQFPLDMLRYDTCWPYSQEDVHRVYKTEGREIKIAGIKEPTVARWNSFLWSVREIKWELT
jgi:hypothetical protein